MPCRDFYDDHPEQYFKDITEPALKKQISFAESALCATLDAFDNLLKNVRRDYDDRIEVDPMDYINFEDAGITKSDLITWRKRHQELDARHRAEEQARINKMKANALAKLTPEERKILGLT